MFCCECWACGVPATVLVVLAAEEAACGVRVATGTTPGVAEVARPPEAAGEAVVDALPAAGEGRLAVDIV